MRILSWNINGIRTLPQYHPWNTLKSTEAILEHIEADIICFQEMKISRSGLDYNLVVPGIFDSFFSFPVNKGGYSGVAVYTNSRTAVPLKAEEGISGRLQPKPPLSSEERISPTYPYAHELTLMPDEEGNTPSDLGDIDTEGRALILDFGLFVLFNLYCPNETSDARLPYKMNFHYTLHERVRRLIEQGREVIVLGDINICSTPLDYCEGHLERAQIGFYDHPARQWMRDWLDPEKGSMIDVVRRFWPDRKGMFTCWSQVIAGRDSNYGSRVDYILVTPGLLPWIKHGDIQPSLKGSDHCPIYIDLHDEIVLESGVKVTLREAMHMDQSQRQPPRIAAKFWDEFSGKQTLLSTFFGKRGNVTPIPIISPRPPTGESPTLEAQTHHSSPPALSESQQSPVVEDHPPADATSSQAAEAQSAPPPPKVEKRKLTGDPSIASSKPKKQKAGQTKLSSFFAKPSTSKSSSPPATSPTPHDSQLESDYQFALHLSSSQDALISESLPVSLSSSQGGDKNGGKAAWSQLLAPIQPPKCRVHNEPAKELTVNKTGPNKGKNFFICSRPVGPGYDRGRSLRLREEVDPQWRCDFFKWSSEVKRESMRDNK